MRARGEQVLTCELGGIGAITEARGIPQFPVSKGVAFGYSGTRADPVGPFSHSPISFPPWF